MMVVYIKIQTGNEQSHVIKENRQKINIFSQECRKKVHDRMFRIIYSFSFRMDDEGFLIRQMYVYENNKKLRQKKEERKQHMV